MSDHTFNNLSEALTYFNEEFETGRWNPRKDDPLAKFLDVILPTSKPDRVAKFCPNCGFNLTNAVPNEGAGVTICSKCNVILKDERPKPDRLAELRAIHDVNKPIIDIRKGETAEYAIGRCRDARTDINELLVMVEQGRAVSRAVRSDYQQYRDEMGPKYKQLLGEFESLKAELKRRNELEALSDKRLDCRVWLATVNKLKAELAAVRPSALSVEVETLRAEKVVLNKRNEVLYSQFSDADDKCSDLKAELGKANKREEMSDIVMRQQKEMITLRDAEVSPMSDLRLERLRHKFDASSDVHIRTTIDEFYNEVIRLRGELAGEKRTADIMSEGRVDAVRKLFTQVDELKAELEMRDGPELEELRVKLKEKNIQIEAMYEGMRSWSEKYNEAILKFGEQEAQIKELKDELAKCGVIAVNNAVLDDAKEPDVPESDRIRVKHGLSVGDRVTIHGVHHRVTEVVDDFNFRNEPEPIMSDERREELSVEYKGGLSGIPVERGETGGFTSVSLGYTEDAVDAINECLTEIKRLKNG